jgi:hypothetical protein
LWLAGEPAILGMVLDVQQIGVFGECANDGCVALLVCISNQRA